MNKYEKLTHDLLNAIETTKPMELTEDGGTCNFDAPTLTLPRWNREKTEEAIKKAGMHSFIWNFGGKQYVLSVPTSGQGNRRTRRAEAIKDALKAVGYDAGMHYQMD